MVEGRKFTLALIVVMALVLLLNNFAAAAVFGGGTDPSQNVEDKLFTADTSSPVGAQPQTGFAWDTLLVTAGLFLLLLVVLGFFVKRINKAAVPVSPWCRILDKQQLGQGHVLYLVELAGRLQILGVTNQSVVKIAELDDADLASEIMQDLAWRAEQTLPPWWTQLFGRVRDRSFAAELRRGEEIR